MSMLRRLSLSFVTIESFSLEPATQWQTSTPNAGRGCVLKLQKPVPLLFQLHV
jgi:hypothetical protein